ncbi:MAG TPA: TetR/AcrR family transcriptional regulator [Chitinophagaceae bacterium]|jgi:AcrR family transcriptional regulator|nr:TetR/AcrR family transcriptional regulator [Chitinophagaceae bacterium]
MVKDQTTEDKILAAAKKVFVRKGMAGARMQDIADEAGINKALLHYYFRNKKVLFEVIFTEAAARLFPKINEVFSSDKSLFEKIRDFCEEYIRVIEENPYLPLFVLNEINQDPAYFLKKVWPGKSRPQPEKLLAQIEKEVKAGVIKPLHPLQLLLNLLSMTIFPFVAKPLLQKNFGMTEQQFRTVMEQRKKEIPAFIIAAIKR